MFESCHVLSIESVFTFPFMFLDSDITALAKDRAYAQIHLDNMSIHQVIFQVAQLYNYFQTNSSDMALVYSWDTTFIHSDEISSYNAVVEESSLGQEIRSI